MLDIPEVKNKIILYLQENGISLPIRIAKAVSLEPLFVSAILSEMIDSKTIKNTNFRLGSSSFYFLEGQEEQLEKIGELYLSGVEKDAFLLLKEKKILSDESQTSPIRIALRKIKDFSIPFNNENKLFWRYVFYEDTVEQIYKTSNNKEEIKDLEEHKNENLTNENENFENKSIENILETIPKQDDKIAFSDKIKNVLEKNGFDYFEILEDNKSEVVGSIIVDTNFGKKKQLVIARNKKLLNEKDIDLAIQKSDFYKMPLLIITSGKLNRKASDKLNTYANLVSLYTLE